MFFVDHKITDGRLDLQSRRRSDWPPASVKLDPDPGSTGEVGDFNCFRNPPANAQVWLDNADALLFQEGFELPSRREPFARGQGNGGLLGYGLKLLAF